MSKIGRSKVKFCVHCQCEWSLFSRPLQCVGMPCRDWSVVDIWHRWLEVLCECLEGMRGSIPVGAIQQMSNTGECREIKLFTKEKKVLYLPSIFSKFTQKLTIVIQHTLNKLAFYCFEKNCTRPDLNTPAFFILFKLGLNWNWNWFFSNYFTLKVTQKCWHCQHYVREKNSNKRHANTHVSVNRSSDSQLLTKVFKCASVVDPGGEGMWTFD